MLQDLLGAQLDLPVRVAIATIVIVALLGLTVFIVRRLSGGGMGSGGRSRQARLAVLDSVAVDQRRRLVLVRRDEVEHLLLVGGTTDIVVEPAIGRPAAREAAGSRELPNVRDALPRETPALREPPARDALARRPAAAALSAPPASEPLASPLSPPALGPALEDAVRDDAALSAEPELIAEPAKAEPAPTFEARRPLPPRRPLRGEDETRPDAAERPDSGVPARPIRPASPALDRTARTGAFFNSLRAATASLNRDSEARKDDSAPVEPRRFAPPSKATETREPTLETPVVPPVEDIAPPDTRPAAEALPVFTLDTPPAPEDSETLSPSDTADLAPDTQAQDAFASSDDTVPADSADAPAPLASSEDEAPAHDVAVEVAHAELTVAQVTIEESESDESEVTQIEVAQVEVSQVEVSQAEIADVTPAFNAGQDDALPVQTDTQQDAGATEPAHDDDVEPVAASSDEEQSPLPAAPLPPSVELTGETAAVPPVLAPEPVEPASDTSVAPAVEPPSDLPVEDRTTTFQAPPFRRVPMFNIGRPAAEAPARREPGIGDMAARLESALGEALGTPPAADTTPPAAVPPQDAPPPAPAVPDYTSQRAAPRMSPARFSPIMRANVTAATSAPAPMRPAAPSFGAPGLRTPERVGADAGQRPPTLPQPDLSLEADLVRQLELALAKEAEAEEAAREAAADPKDKPADAITASPATSPAESDPFDDLEAEMATLLGRTPNARS